MRLTLEQRIDQQDTWTFRECLGLAAEYNVKVRMVVVTVLARGKNYVDGNPAKDGE
ncbi:MAG: hypothetical protein OES38_14825 [Gammaproteobacteria bacterium]|nr:hypothetical protein [Gammaproteobacteria bacterium]